jgi:hypothetical protein
MSQKFATVLLESQVYMMVQLFVDKEIQTNPVHMAEHVLYMNRIHIHYLLTKLHNT